MDSCCGWMICCEGARGERGMKVGWFDRSASFVFGWILLLIAIDL